MAGGTLLVEVAERRWRQPLRRLLQPRRQARSRGPGELVRAEDRRRKAIDRFDPWRAGKFASGQELELETGPPRVAGSTRRPWAATRSSRERARVRENVVEDEGRRRTKSARPPGARG